MIQDIEKIKKEIKNHIEIDITYPIIPGTNIKYNKSVYRFIVVNGPANTNIIIAI